MCRIFITNLPNLASVYLHGLPQLNTVSVRKVPPQTSFCSYRASYHLLNSGRKADICWALLPMTSSLQICVALQALPTQLHSATFSLWGSVATQSFTVQYTVNSDQELNNFFLIFFYYYVGRFRTFIFSPPPRWIGIFYMPPKTYHLSFLLKCENMSM